MFCNFGKLLVVVYFWLLIYIVSLLQVCIKEYIPNYKHKWIYLKWNKAYCDKLIIYVFD